MPILQLFDKLPDAIAQPSGRLWSVFARSLGEQGAADRTALAWRWALTGMCPSPVTLSPGPGSPPSGEELLAEADASAQMGQGGIDAGGQVMQARFVLKWLAGEIGALPLWNVGSGTLHVTDGAEFAPMRAEVDEVYSWALLAQIRCPWRPETVPVGERLSFGWACGAVELLAWVCGESAEGPLSGCQVAGRPSLYEVSLDASRAMTGVIRAREAGDVVRARRREALMETFLWLAGWNPLPPVDRHGHVAPEDCPERDAPCECDQTDRCLGARCSACWRVACVRGFGQGGVPAVRAEAR